MKEINANQLNDQINNGSALKVIDVREAYEVAEGKIPGAIHIPLNQLPANVASLDHNATYALVCASGYRSQIACQYLEQRGFNVLNVRGGLSNWRGKIE